ncbi:MAG: cupin domain-containing protein [Deltaproteobacteria bacterium]|nr:cupin domain-containing protein [Deltaproteobacteria bacterium]
MKPKNLFPLVTLALAMGIVLGTIGGQVLNAQQVPPTQRNGQIVKTIAALEVGPQIPELQGRYLRARVFTYEPGGNGLLHSHKNLPVILYILRGTLTACSRDGRCAEIHEGQAAAEGKDVAHWVENRGTTPLTYLAVDIGKEP